VRTVRPRYIAVEGPIGAGKSSLAEILGAELQARVIRESPEENPFLGAFYRDRSGTRCRRSCSSCCSATRSRASSPRAICSRAVVSCRLPVSRRTGCFASLNLSDDEMALYDRIYQMLKPRTVAPDLVVYLQARTEVLLERIRKRGAPRRSPSARSTSSRSRGQYSEFFFSYTEGPLLIVNASDIDFVGDAQQPCRAGRGDQ